MSSEYMSTKEMLEKAIEIAPQWVEAYAQIATDHPELEELYLSFCLRICKGEPAGSFAFYNAADADFAARYFTVPNIVRMQCRLWDEVHTGHYVEPAYDVLIRKGFLAEMMGDYKYALRCYDSVPLPGSDVKERMHLCSHCVSHPDRKAVDVCTDCGKPICAECRDHNGIYSVSAEAGLPYCVECYEKNSGFVNRNRGI